jgi:hypothetical protein
MRKILIVALALVAAVTFATSASAQTAWAGFIVDGSGGGGCAPTAVTGSELYVAKVPSDASNLADWVYDARAKGGSSVASAMVAGFSYSFLGGNFSANEAGSDGVFVFVTAQNTDATRGDLIMVDSGSPAGASLDASTWQVVGNTIASAFTGLAGSGTTFDGSGSPVNVLGRNWPAAGASSVDVLFGLVIDRQPAIYDAMFGCAMGGAQAFPMTTDHGAIVGYNVYRQNDGGSAPARDSWTDAHWLGYVPVSGFTLAGANGTGGGDSPNDGNPTGDYAGIQDLDALPYSGNEYLIFSDTDVQARGRGPLPAPAAAAAASYWYVVQPVAAGNYANFTMGTAIARVPLAHNPQMADGGIDLDNDGTPEFFSPQSTVGGGLPGLGLTVAGRPLVSAPVMGATNVDPMAAAGRVTLKGEGAGLELSTGLETADIAGYNVFRVNGAERVQINDTLIAANGGEGSVYRVTDRALRRAGGGVYEVEVIFNDGSASRVDGPFTVDATSTRGSSRRGH